MKKWLRRIRGGLGMGLTWAAAWVPFGALWGVAGWLLIGDATPLSYVVVASSILFGGAGFVGGAIFAMVLARLEGSRRFDQLSGFRFVGWGILGGVLLSLLLLISNGWGQLSLPDVMALVTLPMLCAGSAAGSLALARRADDQELLEAGEGIVNVGLTRARSTGAARDRPAVTADRRPNVGSV